VTCRSRSWVTACVVLFFVGCSGEAQHGPSPTGDLSSAPTSTAPNTTTIDGLVIGAADAIGYSVEAPNGWSSVDGHFVVRAGPGVLGMSIWDVGDVPSNPCRWKRRLRDPGPTVGDLAGALSAQKFRHASEPAPVTLAGYDGKYIEWSVPADRVVTGDADFEGCDDPGNGHQDFVSWLGDQAGERYQQVAGQVDRLWILDVQGQTVVVDATYSPDTSEADRDELGQIVESLLFDE
jgi:hypothetical protein